MRLVRGLLVILVTGCLGWNPSNSYGPSKIRCPVNFEYVRHASRGISESEKTYIEGRSKTVRDKLYTYLATCGLDVDLDLIVDSDIKIGLAFSGGGYRSMLTTAGEINAMDERHYNSPLAGLLQSTSYIAALSGGGWALTSLYVNNFTTIDNLSRNVWSIDCLSLPETPYVRSVKEQFERISNIAQDLNDKQDQGFPLSVTDIMARVLSEQVIIDRNDANLAAQWSDIASYDFFKAYQAPVPFLVATTRIPLEVKPTLYSPVIEFSPWELGSFDHELPAFASLKYLGTKLSNGKPISQTCVTGFDNAGFVMATSSSMFDKAVTRMLDRLEATILAPIVRRILRPTMDDTETDVAIYSPNPFKSFKGMPNSVASSDNLYLVDGGENDLNIPLQPLMHRDRKVDVIFAFDNSGQTGYCWPRGKSIVSASRKLSRPSDYRQNVPMPIVPDNTNTFINRGLTSRPTFFGCNGKGEQALLNSAYAPPLIVYIANQPFTTYSNISTFETSISDSFRDDLILNGEQIMTQGNDPDWPMCVGCAIIQRQAERKGIPSSPKCAQCFQKYCWDGVNDLSDPRYSQYFLPLKRQ